MKASEVLRKYRSGRRDFQGVNLRGQSFKGQDLSGADFSEADIRSTNFTGATLRGTNFAGAKCGLQKRWAALLVIIPWLLAGVAAVLIVAGVVEEVVEVIVVGAVVIVLAVAGAAVAGAGAVTLTIIVVVVAGAAVAGALAVPVIAVVLLLLVGAGLGAGTGLGEVPIGTDEVDRSDLGSIAGIIAATLVGAGAVVAIFGVEVTVLVIAAIPGLLVLVGLITIEFQHPCVIAYAATGGTTFRGADLTEANFTGARLKSTDLREANLTRVRWYRAKMLDRARPGDSYIKHTLVREWLTTRHGLKSIITFHGKSLQGINLQGASLEEADFIGTDLSEADLQDADLSRAMFSAANLDGTNLTGACIENWVINSQTKLDNVICNYVFLKRKLISSDLFGDKRVYEFSERRPSDPNKIFQPGDFAKLVEQSLETVDLIFRNGIDWRAFLTSFQKLRVEYGEQNISIQAIEQKSDGTFLIRLTVPPDADDAKKGEIESKAKQSYETNLKVLEAQYHAELKGLEAHHKDEIIKLRKEHNTQILELAKLAASRPITVEAREVTNRKIYTKEYKETHLHDDSRYIETRDSSTYYENYNQPQQTLAEAADEIQKLLQQLEQTNPTATVEQQKAYVDAAISPTLKQRCVGALKAGGETAIEEFLDNPYVNVGKAVVKGWMKPE